MSSKDRVGESQPPAAVAVRLIPSHSNVTLIRPSSYSPRSHPIIRVLTTDPRSKERWHPSSRPERKPGPLDFRSGGRYIPVPSLSFISRSHHPLHLSLSSPYLRRNELIPLVPIVLLVSLPPQYPIDGISEPTSIALFTRSSICITRI